MHRCLFVTLFLALSLAVSAADASRPRIREAGVTIGILPTGPLNAISDVTGVRVGQTTLIRGENVRTGVTVILPHSGNLFREKVLAAVFVGNGFGKLMGSTQIDEMGELGSPIALTSTLNVPRVADRLIDHMLALPGNETVRSINVVVGETNDGHLDDIRGRHVGRDEVFAAIKNASSLKNELQSADGSIMVVIATDAPIDARNLKRIGARAMMGLARTGAAGTNGSGDYAIAFSTARNATTLVRNDDMSPLFYATIEGTKRRSPTRCSRRQM